MFLSRWYMLNMTCHSVWFNGEKLFFCPLFTLFPNDMSLKNIAFPLNKGQPWMDHWWRSTNLFSFIGNPKNFGYLPFSLLCFHLAPIMISSLQTHYLSSTSRAHTSKLIQMLIWHKYLRRIKKATSPLLCFEKLLMLLNPFKVLREWQIHIRFPQRAAKKVCTSKLFCRNTAPRWKMY